MTSGATGALMLTTLCVGSLAAQAITPLPFQRGEVTFFMRATIVMDFTGRAPVARAEFSGGELAQVRGSVEVRVADLRTGIGDRDRHLRQAMRADSFPTIRFQLDGVDPGPARGDTVEVTFRGDLTIRGVTRPVRVPGRVVLAQGAADATASFPVDLREYGVRPPVRMLGALRVHPVTQVTARLSFREPAGP